MNEYNFELIYALSDTDENIDSYVDRLYENGCDDALIGIGVTGEIALDFIRESASAYDAINSALENVSRVIPHAQLIEATPDLASTSDIAKVLGYSRQNIRNLIENHKSSFPLPVHKGNPSLWHLCNVLAWFKERNHLKIDDALIDVATINMQLNLFKETCRINAVVMSLKHEFNLKI